MDFKALSDFLRYITEIKIPGAECLVMYKNELVFSECAGFSDVSSGKKMENGLLYNMYSLTKPVTSVAVLKLAEENKISLDSLLCDFLPEFSEMYIKMDDEIKKADKPILIRHLLTHTSGIDFNTRTKYILSAKREGRTKTREIVREIARDYLKFSPGESWHYGLSHDVLGAVIEVVSQKSLGEYLKTEIFEPLKMENTGFLSDESVYEKMASQYFYNNETRKAQKVSKKNNFKLTDEYESGGAGLISTAGDYMRFANSLTKNDGSLLLPETVNLMRQNHLTPEQKKAFIWESMPDYTYGLGVRVMAEREKYNSPSANGEFGWGGASGTYMLSDPENELSIVYFQHMLGSWEEFVHPRLRNIVYDIIKKQG